MYKKLYWVMIKGSEETVAMTENKEYAEWIAQNFPKECIIRYAWIH